MTRLHAVGEPVRVIVGTSVRHVRRPLCGRVDGMTVERWPQAVVTCPACLRALGVWR